LARFADDFVDVQWLSPWGCRCRFADAPEGSGPFNFARKTFVGDCAITWLVRGRVAEKILNLTRGGFFEDANAADEFWAA